MNQPYAAPDPVKEDPMEPATLAPSPGRAAPLPPPQVHEVPTSDGTEIRLTRYAGTRGPIVLAPGYGNAARAFTVDTVDRNFVQYLREHDYDVWLLDYRASPDLPASRTQFTVDDIATRDWPAAVGVVRKESGADSVQALAHCVGALSLFMAIGGGLEGVRSAVFSALGGHPIPTPANRARSQAHLAAAFRTIGIGTLNTDYDPSSPVDRGLDLAMRALPFKHVCDSPVCRRICFVYGDVFDHSHLNPDTHDALAGIFGISNITFFEHISLMIRKARAVDAHGGDAYLSDLDRYKIPLTFLHGEHNRMFLPRSTERTYDMLRAAHGPDLHRRHVIQGYAHLDCWLGDDADRDVFPIALAELERHPA
jgi:cholesterol oxidase